MKKRFLVPLTGLIVVAVLLATPLRSFLLPHRADLRVVFTADVQGRLEPCGCFEGQMGGLTRIDTLLQVVGRPGDLRLDVGDALGGHQDFHRLHYTYLLEGLALMGFDALNAGAREAGLSAEQLAGIKKSAPLPIISANLARAADNTRIFEPYLVLRRKGRRIAIVGVVDPASMPDKPGAGVKVNDMFSCLQSIVPEIKKKSDAIILLAFADEQALARLASQFYEFDLVLGGDVSQPSQELIRENRSIILYVTNQARALGHLDLELSAKGGLSVVDHEIRLVHWRIPESNRLRQLAATYRETIRETALEIDDPDYLQSDRVPGVRQQASYVGSVTCKPCHGAAHETWSRTAHATAFSSLLKRGADADPQCIGCHTVGFGQPTGYRRKLGQSRLVNVGCESCHGPGSLHLARHKDGAQNDFRFRPLGGADCRSCHHGEFSRPFKWERSWPRVKHGL